MRICVVGPTHPYVGGISHYNTLLCKHLAARHEVLLISYKRRFPGAFFPGKEQKDHKSETALSFPAEFLIDSINPLTWLRAALRIRSFKPDVLLFHWVTPYLAHVVFTVASLARSMTGCTNLLLCHNVVPHETGAVDRFLSRTAFRPFDSFIVHSTEDRENHLRLRPDARVIQHVHPTYDVFRMEEMSRDEAKGALGLSGPVMLFFGFVREYKGLMDLVEAMPRVLDAVPDAKLLVVGEFWDDKEPYLEKIKTLGLDSNVKLVDEYVPNEAVGRYFAASDVVVLPYRTATQSGIVQIAYGFDKPVVTTSVGGLPDVVEEGKTGRLVPPRDPEALAGAVIRVLGEGPESMEEYIGEYRKRFSWDKMVDVVEKAAIITRPD